MSRSQRPRYRCPADALRGISDKLTISQNFTFVLLDIDGKLFFILTRTMNSRERFRLKLGEIASQIETHRLERFKFLCKDLIPEGDMERISSPEALFIELEHRMLLGPNQVEFVRQCLIQVGRNDLAFELMVFDERRGGKKTK